jgi:alcohol dehydrogenase (cytochrome c)
LCCGNTNRGVAVGSGKVFLATANGHLVALDATTGRPLWQQVFVDVRAGESATLAPLVVKDKVIVGSSGGEYGVRGHIDAFELQTGRRAWRRYTVPKPGEPGSETWGLPGAWERGGGSAWITGSYDPELNLLYWSSANASPDFDGSVRPGDNLYTDSVLALDPDDGSLRWHYQFTPHDPSGRRSSRRAADTKHPCGSPPEHGKHRSDRSKRRARIARTAHVLRRRSEQAAPHKVICKQGPERQRGDGRKAIRM